MAVGSDSRHRTHRAEFSQKFPNPIIMTATIINDISAIIQIRALLPAYVHSWVASPPMLRTHHIPTIKRAQPTDGPWFPSKFGPLAIPHNATLPQYINAMSTMTSQY
jgi:hypothetical protein